MYRIKFLAGVSGLLLLGGCSFLGFGDQAPQRTGLAVGDEPIAVQAAGAVLAGGGNAADAATAMYFAMSVTYPVAAGIGGGGICLIHDPSQNRDEEIDFLPRDTAKGGAYAVPGSISGFSLLQSTYGRLPWQRDVSTAEGLASAGFPISHALEVRLADNKDVIRLDAGLAAEFLDESGNVKPEGSVVSNPGLAQSLAAVRILGPSGFYRGALADRLIAYSTAESGAISDSDLRAYAAGRGTAMVLKIGGQIALLPSRRVGAGAFLSSMLVHLVDQQGAVIAGSNLGSSVAAATKSALDEFHLAQLPRDFGATGFAASDPDGQVVTCAVTMNGPFGSGHTAAGTGITLARAPSSSKNAGLAAAFLAPAITLNGTALQFAGAGAGGPNGTAAIVFDLLRMSQGTELERPQQFHSTGLEPYETVNIIACSGDVCAAIPDPAAHGLGSAGGSGTD
ncbi:MAG: gamma-glutamyltransferase [Rhizomicrobium sp.]|jgi:gamma-glutamyltranspeptidase/glutathione hydrolase